MIIMILLLGVVNLERQQVQILPHYIGEIREGQDRTVYNVVKDYLGPRYSLYASRYSREGVSMDEDIKILYRECYMLLLTKLFSNACKKRHLSPSTVVLELGETPRLQDDVHDLFEMVELHNIRDIKFYCGEGPIIIKITA
ncbi:hypothetical protein D3C78_20550 [compost metagenome]